MAKKNHILLTRNELIKKNLGGQDRLPKITNQGHSHLPNFHEAIKKDIVDFSAYNNK